MFNSIMIGQVMLGQVKQLATRSRGYEYGRICPESLTLVALVYVLSETHTKLFISYSLCIRIVITSHKQYQRPLVGHVRIALLTL